MEACSIDSVLPLHIQEIIVDMSNRMVHEQKQKYMIKQLQSKYSFPTIWERCNCDDCYNVFSTTIPLFMQLRFIGDVYDNLNHIKSSSFETIFQDYETFYDAYIPSIQYDTEDDSAYASDSEDEETELLVRHFSNFIYN